MKNFILKRLVKQYFKDVHKLNKIVVNDKIKQLGQFINFIRQESNIET